MAQKNTRKMDSLAPSAGGSEAETHFINADSGLTYDHMDEQPGWKISYFRQQTVRPETGMLPLLMEELLVIGLLLVLITNSW